MNVLRATSVFLRHCWQCVAWSARAWWQLKGTVGISAAVGTGFYVAIGLLIYKGIIAPFPEFQRLVQVSQLDETWAYIVTGLFPAVLVGVIVFLVLLLVSPSQIWIEQRNEILRLKISRECPLELLFCESDDLLWRDNKSSVDFRIRIRNRSNRTIDDVTVTRDVVPLKKKRILAHQTESLQGLPLILSSEFPAVREPTISHQIHPGQIIEFMLLQAGRGSGKIAMRHAKTKKVNSLSQQAVWTETPPGWAAQGKYCVTVRVCARDMPEIQKRFEINSSGRVLTITEDCNSA